MRLMIDLPNATVRELGEFADCLLRADLPADQPLIVEADVSEDYTRLALGFELRPGSTVRGV